MEGLRIVKSLIQQGDVMMKLDVKDTYYAVPIHHSHRKYLRFIFQNRTEQMSFSAFPSACPELHGHSQRH